MASRIAGIGIGVIAGVIALAPWLVTGGRLPLQNLWAVETMPEAMPFVLMPISQYMVTTPLAIFTLGAVVAGVIARGRPAWAFCLGLVVVQVVALVQPFVILRDGLGDDVRSRLYFGGMLGAAIFSLTLSQLAFWLVSRRGLGVVAVGMGLAALPVAWWIGLWATALFPVWSVPTLVSSALQWIPAVIVGVALGICGLRPVRRVAVWIVDLVLLWILPALTTGLVSAVGTRVFGDDLRAMGEYALQVIPRVLLQPPWPVLLAAVIGVALWAVRAMMARRRAAGA